MRQVILAGALGVIAWAGITDANAQRRGTRVAAHRGPTVSLTGRMNSYVALDARGWVMNSYDSGSMHNVRVVAGSLASGNYTLRGDYTYNDGRPGWVLARHTRGRLECVEFWDMRGCRPIRGTEPDRPSSYAGPERGPNGCVLSNPDVRC